MNKFIEEFVLGYFFCNNDELKFAYDKVIDSLDTGKIPEGLEVWGVFENYSPEELEEFMSDMYSALTYFGWKVKNV